MCVVFIICISHYHRLQNIIPQSRIICLKYSNKHPQNQFTSTVNYVSNFPTWVNKTIIYLYTLNKLANTFRSTIDMLFYDKPLFHCLQISIFCSSILLTSHLITIWNNITFSFPKLSFLSNTFKLVDEQIISPSYWLI